MAFFIGISFLYTRQPVSVKIRIVPRKYSGARTRSAVVPTNSYTDAAPAGAAPQAVNSRALGRQIVLPAFVAVRVQSILAGSRRFRHARV
jgi:hypothetical protein